MVILGGIFEETIKKKIEKMFSGVIGKLVYKKPVFITYNYI